MNRNDEIDRIRDRLRQEYYDRKLRRAEEVLPFLGWIGVLMILMFLVSIGGCSITAERYKVPTITAHSDGNPERVAAYQCKDGYWKARDTRGVLWCDSTDEFDRYPLDQDAYAFTCEEGIVVVHRRIGQDRWECVTDVEREIF